MQAGEAPVYGSVSLRKRRTPGKWFPEQACNREIEDGTMRALDIADCINETCLSSGKPVQADSLTEYDGHVVGFCNPGCRDKFESGVP